MTGQPFSLSPYQPHILLTANFDLQVNGTGFVLEMGSWPHHCPSSYHMPKGKVAAWRPGPLLVCCCLCFLEEWRKGFPKASSSICVAVIFLTGFPFLVSWPSHPRAQESFPVSSLTLGKAFCSHWVPST